MSSLTVTKPSATLAVSQPECRASGGSHGGAGRELPPLRPSRWLVRAAAAALLN